MSRALSHVQKKRLKMLSAAEYLRSQSICNKICDGNIHFQKIQRRRDLEKSILKLFLGSCTVGWLMAALPALSFTFHVLSPFSRELEQLLYFLSSLPACTLCVQHSRWIYACFQSAIKRKDQHSYILKITYQADHINGCTAKQISGSGWVFIHTTQRGSNRQMSAGLTQYKGT